MIETVKELSLLNGVSGKEDAVREAIIKKIEGKCQYHVDNLGSIIVFKKGKKTPKNKVLLTAHMDEVGFILTHIEDNGYIRFSSCGSIDPRVVVSRTVTVGKDERVGVIGTKALHMKTAEERGKTYEIKDLYIDIGAKDKEEAEKYVKLGDRAVFRTEFTEYGDGFVRCKALDDRAGCAILIDLIENYDEYDMNYAFTVQEETGCTGALCAANAVQPDIAVVVETTPAGDIPGTSDDKVSCKLKHGPVIYFKDKTTIYNNELYNLIMDKAEKWKIPHQSKNSITGTNEARVMQVSGGGIKVAAISTPCRYLHSASCTMTKEDFENTHKLIKKLLPEFCEM